MQFTFDAADQLFHIEVVPGKWRWTRTGNGEADLIVETAPEQEVVSRDQMQMKPGAQYVVSVQRLDINGQPIGPVASEPFTIPGVSIRIPSRVKLI